MFYPSASSFIHEATSSQYPFAKNVSLCAPSNSLHRALPSVRSCLSAFICAGGTSSSRLPERNKIGVVGGMCGSALAASHFSVRRNGSVNLGIWGMMSGTRDESERKVFSMMTPESWCHFPFSAGAEVGHQAHLLGEFASCVEADCAADRLAVYLHRQLTRGLSP